MKTRRILAASTAALLAFGTTAIVASAAEVGDVIGWNTVTSSAKAGASDLTADSTAAEVTAQVEVKGKAVKVTAASGGTASAWAEDAAATEIPAADYTATATYDSETSKWTVTFTTSLTGAVASDGSAGAVVAIPDVEISVTAGEPDPVVDPAHTVTSAGSKSTDNIDEDGLTLGTIGGKDIIAKISDKNHGKFEGDDDDWKLSVSGTTILTVVNGEKTLVSENANVVKDLDKSLIKEIKKIEADKFDVININLANGIYKKTTAPAGIQFTVTLPYEAKVYHVNGKTVDKLKSEAQELSNGDWEITFETKTFSPFIFTSAELKNAKATNKDNEPTDSAATSDGSTSTNPDTGIALAIAPVVLAAGAVAVVALKKKH